MSSAGLEHEIPAIKRLYTWALDRTATGMGPWLHVPHKLKPVIVIISNSYTTRSFFIMQNMSTFQSTNKMILKAETSQSVAD